MEHNKQYDNLTLLQNENYFIQLHELFCVFRKFYKETHGLMLDLGAYTKALEYACDVKAEVVGKPDPSFFGAAVEDMGLKPEEVGLSSSTAYSYILYSTFQNFTLCLLFVSESTVRIVFKCSVNKNGRITIKKVKNLIDRNISTRSRYDC